MNKVLQALENAEEFIDRHSEPWYRSGQELLAEVREAIALMRGQSEKPRAYFCPMDYGPGMLMHNDETATAMMAYFIPKGQTFIPLYEGQPLPSPPKPMSSEMRELAQDVRNRFFWRVSPDDKRNHLIDDDAVRAVVSLCDALLARTEAGADEWPFVEEIGRDGKPTGYWLRKGSPAAARNSQKGSKDGD